MKPTRRGLLASGAALALAADAPALRVRAASRGILYGASVEQRDLAGDPDYASAILRECAILTPGIEAKWPVVHPQPAVFRFAALDAIADFAARGGLKLHMHNLVWSVGMPDWLRDALLAGQGEALLRTHVETVAGRYRGRVESWDVVNEPVNPHWPTAADGTMTTPWRRGLGPGFIDLALRLTRGADPAARLLINDDDLEYDTPDSAAKRATYLRLIEALLRAGAPLGGFGLEAHLKPHWRLDETGYRGFLRALAGMGLTLYVTELDVLDRDLPADSAARDGIVADLARRYLDVALDERAVRRVITWGLSDRYTYMNRDTSTRRADGLRARCLPLDENLRPKPFYWALARAFDGAPAR